MRLRCFIGRHYYIPFGSYGRQSKFCARCTHVKGERRAPSRLATNEYGSDWNSGFRRGLGIGIALLVIAFALALSLR
jgi:hypothetical protein